MTTANELPVIQLVSFALSGPLSVESVYRRIEPLLDRFEISSPSIARLSLRSALDSTFRLPPISIARRSAYLVAATKRIADTLAQAEAYDVKAETALAAAVGRESEYSDALVIEFKSVRTPAGVAKYKAPIGTPIVGGVAQVNPVGHIPEADWLKGQAEWKAKGEAIWKANEWKPHAHDASLAPPSAHSRLLADRTSARAKYPVGHSERIAAERAVRQSRKAGSAEEAPGIVSGVGPVDENFKNAMAKSDDLLKQTGAPVVKPPPKTAPSVRINRHGTPDKRIAQGQTPSNFIHPGTNEPMSKSSIGDTYEELFKAKGSKLLEKKFGEDYRVISHASGGARNTPLDFQLGDKYGGELKTLSKLAKNQKTAIKAEEVERKLKELADKGLQPLLTVQVVDQSTGHVDVYTHDAFASKKVSTMLKLGSYEYTKDDFNDALQRAGYSGRTPDAMAERLEGGEEYERLLKARLTAKKSYPAGHPERLKAEKAVRDARKRIHGGGDTPVPVPVTRTSIIRETPAVRAIPTRSSSSGTKNLTASITSVYRWSTDPEVNAAFEHQASTAINRQFDHQASKLPHSLVNGAINVTVTDTPLAGQRTALAAYGGSSLYGSLSVHPKVFPHSATSMTGASVKGPFRDIPGMETTPERVLANAKEAGWWVPTDDKWSLADNIIAHEVGHGVNDSVFDRSGSQGIPNDSKFWIDFSDKLGVVAPKAKGLDFSDRTKPSGVKSYSSPDIERWMVANKSQITDLVSTYGSSDPHEMFAELWSEYTLSSNPRPPAKLYGDYVTQLLNAKSDSLSPATLANFKPNDIVTGKPVELPYARVGRMPSGEWVVQSTAGTTGMDQYAKTVSQLLDILNKVRISSGGRPDTNETPSVSAHTKAVADLKRAEASGRVSSARTAQGSIAKTHVVQYKNGTKFIDKTGKTIKDTEREELAAKVSEIIGAGAPAVIRDAKNPRQLYQPFVEGKLPVDLWNSVAKNRTDKNNRGRKMSVWQTPEGIALKSRLRSMMTSTAGKRVGLLDLLTGNTDRNDANWVIAEGDKPVPIDHGKSWVDGKIIRADGLTVYPDPEKPPEEGHAEAVLNNSSSFIEKLTANDFTPQQLSEYKQQLEKLATDPTLSKRQQSYMQWTLRTLDAFMRGGDSAV
jgi:hypothetical protein